MALIGRNTVTGNFIKCSDLTPDGSTTTFTLTNSTTGDNVYPGNQNSLLVSVSGVIQNPGTAYTINNNQITFTTAPSISDTIDFIVIMGDLVAIGTPSDDTVDTAHIKDGAVHNTKLQNSAITINGTSISLGASGDISAGTDWQSVVTADGSTATTASAGEGYFIDTTSNAHTINLPSSPTQGDEVTIVDYAGTFETNNVTIGRNGSNIDGVAVDGSLKTNRLNVRFVYIDATQGWRAIFDDASESYGATYISATGGTVTTSGDYKIHTFTGDGCFVVSDAGNPAGSDTVEILAVGAGGGGGGDNGGGGAGGTVAQGPSIPVSSTTYPITIGSGGTGGSSPSPPSSPGTTGNTVTFLGNTVRGGSGGRGASNSPSTFTNYSNGGGGAGVGDDGSPCAASAPRVCGVAHPTISGYTIYGGNNGGAGRNTNSSQNPGPGNRAGGGAGSGAVGEGGTAPGDGGAGGIGTQINICGSNYYWGGGGGGGTNDGSGGNGGNGGGGGGGAGPSPGHPAATGGAGLNCGANGGSSPGGGREGGAGGANTGGGGGGSGRVSPGDGGNGGSGIVIIKYKFQN